MDRILRYRMSAPGPRDLLVNGLLVGLMLVSVAAPSAGPILAGTAGSEGAPVGSAAGPVRSETEPVGSKAGEETFVREPMHRRVARSVLFDHERFYSTGCLRDLSFGLLGAWLLANSQADVTVQDWYRDRVRTPASDDLAGWVKPLGNGRIAVPALSGALLTGTLLERFPAGRTLSRWSGRSLRALAVGAPPLLFLQVATGGSRPREDDSRWRPFEDDNGVSGHSFVGAVPFLSAAGMTGSRPLKALLVSGSALCGLSRINDDAHYLSQAAMGWWVAYLACRSVDETERRATRLQLVPVLNSPGLRAAIVLQISW
jgi:membrane-associated phospholipid phosphatase